MFLSVPGITTKDQPPGKLRNLTLALIADRFPHNVWTHVHTDGSAEEGQNMVAVESTSDTQMVTPLLSRFPVAFSAPTFELKHWPFAQLQSACWRVGNKWETSPFSMSTRQALNSADPDQMIQGLQSSLVKLTAQFPVSLQWVPANVGLTGNKTANRPQKLAVELCRPKSVTYREAKTLLHSRFNGDWKKRQGWIPDTPSPN